jgi:hypothetical protein
MAALNAGDEPALLATLHFPHYRLAGRNAVGGEIALLAAAGRCCTLRALKKMAE